MHRHVHSYVYRHAVGHVLHTVGKALAEAVILGTGTSVSVPQTCLRRCRRVAAVCMRSQELRFNVSFRVDPRRCGDKFQPNKGAGLDELRNLRDAAADIVMAYTIMAYTIMAYTVMAFAI